MKTPVQELFEKLWNADKDKFTWNAILIEMLEKEKEVMCQFQSEGQYTDFWAKYNDHEDCFDQTFNTNEK